MSNAKAAETAKRRARDNLTRALSLAVEPVHCPTCGMFQPDMVRVLRDRHGKRYEPNKYASERIAIPVSNAWRAVCSANTVESYTKFKEVWPTLSGQADKKIKELRYPPHLQKFVSRFLWIAWGALVLFTFGIIFFPFELVLTIALPTIIILSLTWLWKRFGQSTWKNLPEHLRRGLFRFYLAVTVPWVLWSAYQLSDALQRHRVGHLWHYVWSLLAVPIGSPILLFVIIWIYEGFRKPQVAPPNLRDVVTRDILLRPDVAAYEYFTTGRLFGKQSERFKLDVKRLSDEQQNILPPDFYGFSGVDPDKLAAIFAYGSGDAMIERLALLFTKWGYLDRNQMLNKIIDEEVDRQRRKVSAIMKAKVDKPK